MGELPVVDVQKLQHGGTARAEEMGKLKRALFGPGFVYLSNTGVASEAVFDDMREFFRLPHEEKMRNSWSDPAENSGYAAPGVEALDEDSAEGDPKEAYDMSKDHLHTSRWNLTSAVDFWQAMNRLKEVVLGGYEEVLGLEEGFFNATHSEEFNTLRFLHYLPVNLTVEQKPRYRVGPHSDYGSITLLIQDPVGGLQLLDRISGRWVDATPIPGTVLCNTADLMMRWTNDRLPSTLHRVVAAGASGASEAHVAASQHDRYSLVYFVNPNTQHVVENLMAQETARYPPVSSLNYLVQRLSATFEPVGVSDSSMCAEGSCPAP